MRRIGAVGRHHDIVVVQQDVVLKDHVHAVIGALDDDQVVLNFAIDDQGQIAELIVAADQIVVAIAADLRCNIVVGEIVGLSHRVDAVVVAVHLIDDPVRAGGVGRKSGVDAGVAGRKSAMLVATFPSLVSDGLPSPPETWTWSLSTIVLVWKMASVL